MKKIILASTSTLYGGKYLEYLTPVVGALFDGIKEILFIPFARPGGISHEEYTKKASDYFDCLNIRLKGLHECSNPQKAIQDASAFFTGGGNTFLLVRQLHLMGLMELLKNEIIKGKPYLGTSAGSNIGGVSMQTTNDMPIVYPPSFTTMSLVPFNINPHYLDPTPELKHNGETRETRIKEYHTQNNTPVVGLREGSWIQVKGDKVTAEGTFSSRIFEKGRRAYELEPGSDLVFSQ